MKKATIFILCVFIASCVPGTKDNISLPFEGIIQTKGFLPTSQSPNNPIPTKNIISTNTQGLTKTNTNTKTTIRVERASYDTVSGTYKNDRGNAGYCELLIAIEPRIDDNLLDRLDFELFCIRGAPSYDSGHTLSDINYKDNVAVYVHGELCTIVFQFREYSINVTQIGFDCGWGFAVYSDGEYKLIDEKIPKLGCLGLGKTCQQ
jgi:hypothetical protein